MLNEPDPRDKHRMFPLKLGTQSSQIQRQKVEWWLSGGEGRGAWGVIFNGYRVSVLQDENSSGDGWW